WFPKVIQGVEPFVSSKDIDKGSNWTVELANQLADSAFGVVCLTPDNLLSPWLNYEAGAIMSSVRARVCPVLLGVAKETVRPPLSQLQMTDISIDEFDLLMRSVNKAMGSPLTEPRVDESVRVWWSLLDEQVKRIAVPPLDEQVALPPEPPKPQTSVEEMLEEVLVMLRRLESLQPLPGRRRTLNEMFKERVSPGQLASLTALVPSGNVQLQSDRSGNPVVAIIVPALPEPLPDNVYRGVSDWALDTAEVVLKGPDREVVFDTKGSVSEPPF
ncbi:MAG: toll/interleukin-1 receptor domain-containing protein, partial [Propionicimonas sp.]